VLQLNLKRYILVCLTLAVLASTAVHSQAQSDDEGDAGTANSAPSQSETNSNGSENSYDGSDEARSMRGFTSPEPGSPDGLEGLAPNLQREHILPLDSITARMQELTDGRIIDAELKSRGKDLRYQLKVLESDDRLRRYIFDAHSGRLIGVN
jgi:uncharacterized membrane protein YkoI